MSSKYPYLSNLKCESCSKLIVIAQSKDLNKKYCSKECVSEGKKVKKEVPSCKTCSSPIAIKRSRDYDKKFCNSQCSGLANLRANKKCLICEKSYHPKYNTQKYCSYSCMGIAQTSTYEKECIQCGKVFILHNKAYEKRGKGKYCSAKCGTRKFSVDETYFEKINTFNKAYWLGFLFADGYNNYNEITINLHSKDTEHIEKFRTALSSKHKIKKHPTRNIVTFKIGSNKIGKDLHNLGCIRNKSLVMDKPKNIEEKFLPAFIRGYFDGDGYVSDVNIANGARFSIHCAAPLFREWLFAYLKDTVGIKGITNPKYQSGRNITVSNKKGVLQFKDYIYGVGGYYLDRKFLRFDAIEKKFGGIGMTSR